MATTGRFTATLALVALMSAAVFGQTATDTNSVVLVRDGKALCRILVADRPGKTYEPDRWHAKRPSCWLYFAAHDLAAYIRKSTGAEPEVITDSAKVKAATGSSDGLVNIHLGLTDYVKSLNLDLPTPQGYVIRFPDRKTMVIAGIPVESSGLNTVYGVHRFLERHLGIRWLFPGKLGEYVPERETLTVPAVNVRKVPSCGFRGSSGWGKVYGPRHEERWEPLYWHIRSGGTFSSALKFNHNVGNIIDPDEHRESRPDFFPMIDGKRVIPPPGWKRPKGYLAAWEPCYSADGIVEASVRHVLDHFEQKPDSYSYSLAVNDGAQICECNVCRKTNAHLPDWCESQTYYEWANSVVTRVREHYPDRYFGLLAYNVVSIPPRGIRLDDHIVPILAWDLRYFADPEIGRAKSQEQVDNWKAASPAIGWYDYTFEGSYFVPAFQAHFVARTLKKLYEKNGLRFYYDEVHPGKYFRNAPQQYMKKALLWDIERDADEILSEWYELAVGKKAAPFMAEYFGVWEEFWTEKVVRTEWFKERIEGERVAPFLQRVDCRYMGALSQEEVAKADELLQTAVRLAETETQKARAQFFYDYFAMARDKFFMPYIAYADMKRDKPQPQVARNLHRYGFESHFETWGAWKSKYSTAKHGHDPADGHSKPGCVVFDTSGSLGGSLAFTKTFEMPAPGKTYEVSGWVKTSEETRIALNVWLKTADGPFGKVRGSKGQFKFIEKVDSAGEWKKLSIAFPVPETAWEEVIELYCCFSAAPPVGSKFWLDDVAFAEIAVAE